MAQPNNAPPDANGTYSLEKSRHILAADSYFRDPRQIWGRVYGSAQNTRKSSKIAKFPEQFMKIRDFG
ncbi:hypothetical protein OUZ56_027240 [Daphnia magna]|uniref:Uncharacterized protein n=1 Tax=Daphnia magna TaxID=35525 RepID=A0ABQ9ZP75_9CRUS|nr:hypothetical protein OUZ56_027240 [Daphnia magna]